VCVEQEPQARGHRQGAQKVAGAGARGPNLATEKRARNQSREARAARPRALVRPETWGWRWLGRVTTSSSPKRRGVSYTTVVGICCFLVLLWAFFFFPWRLGVGTMRVFHESVTIVRVGSVGCWFAFIIVYHSVRIIYVSCVAGLCRR